MQLKALMCVVLILTATSARADWSGKGEAGAVVSSGNTQTQTANVKLALKRESGNWKNTFGGTAMHASDDDGTTAQRWEVFTQEDYNFSPKTFWFGAVRYEDDRFSGFEYQGTLSTGLGRKFIDSDRTRFVGTAGIGYKSFETRDAFDDNDVPIEEGERNEDVIFRGTLDFEHQLTDTTMLLDKFITEAGADNVFYQNDLSIEVRIAKILALAVGYSARHNTDPPPGFEKTDTLTTLNLVCEIK